MTQRMDESKQGSKGENHGDPPAAARSGGGGGGGSGGGGGGRGGGGGGGGGQGRRRADDGRRRQAEQSALLNQLERTRRYSGLFFGVYVLAHMIHQASATFGPAGYDRLRAVLRALTLDHVLLEVVLVWAPLAVHLASDLAFRGAGGQKGGGLRRRFSFYSGYSLLALVAVHVLLTRVFGAEPSEYAFAPLAERLATAGPLPLLFLIVLSATASVHVAAGSINAVHQIKSLDRSRRALLDWSIVGLAAALFVGVCCGVFALRAGSG